MGQKLKIKEIRLVMQIFAALPILDILGSDQPRLLITLGKGIKSRHLCPLIALFGRENVLLTRHDAGPSR
jgi:hypothetical protein